MVSRDHGGQQTIGQPTANKYDSYCMSHKLWRYKVKWNRVDNGFSSIDRNSLLNELTTSVPLLVCEVVFGSKGFSGSEKSTSVRKSVHFWVGKHFSKHYKTSYFQRRCWAYLVSESTCRQMSACWQLCESFSQCHQNLNPLSKKRPLMAESKKPIWKISTVKSNKVKFRPTAYAKFQKSKVPYSWWWFNFSERSVFPIFLWLDGQLFPRNHRIFKKYSWFQKIESYWSNCAYQRILHRNAFHQGTKSAEEISARDQIRIAGLAICGSKMLT